jgi:hypothetical protein
MQPEQSKLTEASTANLVPPAKRKRETKPNST